MLCVIWGVGWWWCRCSGTGASTSGGSTVGGILETVTGEVCSASDCTAATALVNVDNVKSGCVCHRGAWWWVSLPPPTPPPSPPPGPLDPWPPGPLAPSPSHPFPGCRRAPLGSSGLSLHCAVQHPSPSPSPSPIPSTIPFPLSPFPFPSAPPLSAVQHPSPALAPTHPHTLAIAHPPTHACHRPAGTSWPRLNSGSP